MYEDIQKQFNAVIAYSQGIPIEAVNSNDIFRTWSNNKEEFIDLLGGLIYEYPHPIKIKTDSKHKEKIFSIFLEWIRELKFSDKDELIFFINANKLGFFENTTSIDYEFQGQKIPKGMKLLKAFKYFCKDEELLHKIQDKASAFIQQNTLTGRLCLSVHPLDFLSTSENCHKWHSCHCLNGEYRAGGIVYMMDSATIVAYVKSDKGDVFKLPLFPEEVLWNSKKWRMLLHFNEDKKIVVAGRPYPFGADEILDIILDIIINKGLLDGRFEDAFDNLNKDLLEWSEKYVTRSTFGNKGELRYKYFSYIDNKLHTFNELMETAPTNDYIFFNDITNSSFYMPKYSFYYPVFNGTEHSAPKPFHVGNELVPCLGCGDTGYHSCLMNNNTLLCNKCWMKFKDYRNQSFGVCEYCGSDERLENLTKAENGAWYCRRCFRFLLKENEISG